MTEQQKQNIAKAWKLIHDAFPDMHGFINFNLTPSRDYANVTVNESLALEFNGALIKNLNKRANK